MSSPQNNPRIKVGPFALRSLPDGIPVGMVYVADDMPIISVITSPGVWTEFASGSGIVSGDERGLGTLGDVVVTVSDPAFGGDRSYHDLTINAGVTVSPPPGDMLILRVQGTLRVDGTISSDGFAVTTFNSISIGGPAPSAGGGGGGGGGAGNGAGGASGSNGSDGNGSGLAISFDAAFGIPGVPGTGGAGGTSQGAGLPGDPGLDATAGTAGTPGATFPYAVTLAGAVLGISPRFGSPGQPGSNGGTGGTGDGFGSGAGGPGGVGGAGGAGGGAILIFATNVIVNGAITCNGSDGVPGANGIPGQPIGVSPDAGGGGGGGGGAGGEGGSGGTITIWRNTFAGAGLVTASPGGRRPRRNWGGRVAPAALSSVAPAAMVWTVRLAVLAQQAS